MTDERNSIDSGAETDAGVSEAYRDTTEDRTPESLNRAILDQAAKAARPRYSRLILWTRPMAWAATVMLSVAIVLQLTQAPVPESSSFGDGTYDMEAPADAPVGALEEAVMSDEATNAVPKTEALRSTAKQVAPAALSEARQRPEQTKATVAEQEQAAPEFDVSELKAKDQDMLQRADDMARMREGDNREAAPINAPPQSFSTGAGMMRLVSEPAAPLACDETATAAAESWLQCITNLEAAGLNDAAREERKLLAAAFPDFDTP